MRPILLLAALASLLPACDQTHRLAAGLIGDDTARQAAEYRRAAEAGDWHAIASTPVIPCDAEGAACGTLHALRGNACLTLAMAARGDRLATCPAPDRQVLAWLECAQAAFHTAGRLLTPATRPQAAALRANALYCLAEADSVAAGQALARAAEQAAAAAGTPDGLLWAARAATFQARAGAGPTPARCAALDRGAQLLARAPRSAATDAASRDRTALRAQLPECP